MNKKHKQTFLRLYITISHNFNSNDLFSLQVVEVSKNTCHKTFIKKHRLDTDTQINYLVEIPNNHCYIYFVELSPNSSKKIIAGINSTFFIFTTNRDSMKPSKYENKVDTFRNEVTYNRIQTRRKDMSNTESWRVQDTLFNKGDTSISQEHIDKSGYNKSAHLHNLMRKYFLYNNKDYERLCKIEKLSGELFKSFTLLDIKQQSYYTNIPYTCRAISMTIENLSGSISYNIELAVRRTNLNTREDSTLEQYYKARVTKRIKRAISSIRSKVKWALSYKFNQQIMTPQTVEVLNKILEV